MPPDDNGHDAAIVDTDVLADIVELVVEIPEVHRVRYSGLTATFYDGSVTLIGLPQIPVPLGLSLTTTRALSVVLDRLLLAVEGR